MRPKPEQEAALDCSRDTAVTASAGTGKTFVLTHRLLRCLEADVPLDGIVAITFTEKAAAEMKEKVRDKITGRIVPGDPMAARFDAVRDELFAANISTIHAFCAQLLRENPVEAGVEHGFNVISGVDQAALIDHTLARVLDAADRDAGLHGPLQTLLARHGTGQITSMFAALISQRDLASSFTDPDRDGAVYASPDTILDHWRSMAQLEKAEAVNRLVADMQFYKALVTLAGCEIIDAAEIIDSTISCAATLADGDADDESRVEAIMELFLTLVQSTGAVPDVGSLLTVCGIPQEQEGAMAGAMMTIADGIVTIRDDLELTIGVCDEDAAHTVHALLALYREYLARYKEAKRELNVLDFEDLLELADGLLRDNPDVADRYRKRFRHVLVDEFQDTDPVQWRIIRSLWNEGRDGQRLFIVGDPKQSIYSFRNADVTIFNDAKRAIVSQGGVEPELSLNFRSLPEVVDLVRAVFPHVLSPRLPAWDRVDRTTHLGRPFEAKYGADPVPVRTTGPVTGSVELVLPGEPEEGVTGLKDHERELYALAGRLKEIIEGGEKQVVDGGKARDARWGDVTVLIQARTNLATLEDALDSHRVPYYVYKGSGFFQTQEVRDMASLVAALADPEDDASFAAVCRSPFFALSDDELVRASLDRTGGLRAGVGRLAESGGSPRAGRAMKLFSGWSDAMGREPVHQLLSRALEESGAWAAYASLHRGDQRIANVRKLLDMARDAEDAPSSDAVTFLVNLASQIDTETKEGAARVVGEEEKDAVQIMTVHAAKGLQFPITVVPGVQRAPMYSAREPLLLDEEVGVGIKAPDEDMEFEDTMARKLIKKRLRRKTWAEHKRLFYVAATRASDHLILSGTAEKVTVTRGTDDPMQQDKWLGWLFEALGIDPRDLPEGSFRAGPLDVRIVTPVLPGRPTLRGTPLAGLADDDPVLSARAEPPPALAPRVPSARPERMSPTAVHLYRSCPACYKARYVLGVPGKRVAAAVGRGAVPATVRGTVVHAALERGLTDRNALEALCREHGIADGTAVTELAGEAGRAVASFAASKLGGKVSAADTVMREQEFSFVLQGVRIHGFIDLLFRDAGGKWHVVDHKTNRVDEENCEERMRGTYGLQMALYRLAVARATGARPEEVEATIFCTAIGREVDMTGGGDVVSPDEAVEAVRRVLDAIEREEFDAPPEDERKEHVCTWCPFREVAGCGETRWLTGRPDRDHVPETADAEGEEIGEEEM